MRKVSIYQILAVFNAATIGRNLEKADLKGKRKKKHYSEKAS